MSRDDELVARGREMAARQILIEADACRDAQVADVLRHAARIAREGSALVVLLSSPETEAERTRKLASAKAQANRDSQLLQGLAIALLGFMGFVALVTVVVVAIYG